MGIARVMIDAMIGLPAMAPWERLILSEMQQAGLVKQG